MRRFLLKLRLALRRWSGSGIENRDGQFSYAIPLDASVDRLRSGLAAMSPPGAHEPTPLDAARPVFVLGVGWRTGSTLLQRICCTDPSLIVWGESLGNMGLITRLAESLCIPDPDGWPWPQMFLQPDQAQSIQTSDFLVTEFIANLTPPPSDFRAALQQWLFRWLGQPAEDLGYSRWGLKEVRLGGGEALLLRWLFPRASFLGIIRHPLDAYRSVREAGGADWVEPRTGNPEAFARHWNRVALSLQQLEDEFPFRMLKYEDLIRGRVDYASVAELTSLNLDPQRALAIKAGGSTHEESALNARERATILRHAMAGMRAYGYE